VGDGAVAEGIRGKGGGDAICSFGRAGVEDHLFNRKDRGRTLFRTAVPFLPRKFRERPLSDERSSVLVAGKVGNAGTELNASLSSNKDGDPGRSKLGNDRLPSP
jgi:hypothetical protein